MSDSATRFVTLEQFVAVDEPGAEPLAAGADGGSVLPARGLVVVYGNGGAGKTTALIDAVVHLAAGQPWLGLVTPPRPLAVIWIENEGPRPEFRKKLGRKLTAWHGASVAGRVAIYHDPWEQFSFRDEDARDALVQLVADIDADLVIAGPVKAIGMKGAGTDDDIADFLLYVDDVRRRTGVAVALVHHENRAGQISGAWESRPDTLLHVQAQGHGRTRLYWQKVRWCSELHGRSTALAWAPGESFTVEERREEITEDTIADAILVAVDALPGGSWSKIREKVRGNAELAAKVRDRLLASGKIVNTASRDAYFNLTRADDPALTRSELRTGSERPLSLLPDGDAAPSRSRSRYIGTGNGTERQNQESDELARLVAEGEL